MTASEESIHSFGVVVGMLTNGAKVVLHKRLRRTAMSFRQSDGYI